MATVLALIRKTVDFLVCNKEDLQPRVAIELDGSSHALSDRRERDEFVEELFARVGFPLLRFAKSNNYDKFAIATQIGKPLGLIPRRPNA